MKKLRHPSIISREHEVISMFELLSSESLKGEYVELSDVNSLITQGAKSYEDEDDKNKFKGDMFEIFAEVYFSLITSKVSSGVANYEPLSSLDLDDYGVDGVGMNYSGNPCVVQVKYRTNVKNEITYSDLAKTWVQAEEDELVSNDRNLWRKTLILFTNSKGANEISKKRFKKFDRLYVINDQTIKNEVNGNVHFWTSAYELIKNSIQ